MLLRACCMRHTLCGASCTVWVQRWPRVLGEMRLQDGTLHYVASQSLNRLGPIQNLRVHSTTRLEPHIIFHSRQRFPLLPLPKVGLNTAIGSFNFLPASREARCKCHAMVAPDPFATLLHVSSLVGHLASACGATGALIIATCAVLFPLLCVLVFWVRDGVLQAYHVCSCDSCVL